MTYDVVLFCFFCFKQNTAYEMRISDWIADVCSSYLIPYVTHVQMNESVGLDFARSIKASMRSDPDVIILGEIRDTVTASKAIQAAEKIGRASCRERVGQYV